MTTEEAIFLINDKKTTIDAICAQLFRHVETYQQSREDYYMQEFEEKVTSSPDEFDPEKIDEYTESIFAEIASDSRCFIKEYTNNLSDGLLDAINDNKVDKKSCKLFLTILSVMEEVLIKAFNVESSDLN
jgi:hypothetical protein